ncbi:MAG: hypothetical protein VW875_11290 [Planctomycetaceae bacterium]
MLVRVVAFSFVIACSLLMGCSLPLNIDDDALGVSGGLVPAPTRSQRANSNFVRQDSNGRKNTSEPELQGGNEELKRDSEIMPSKNFRPFIP